MSRLKFQTGFVPATLLILILFIGCKQKKRILKSPPHYNFSLPFTDKLDIAIREISGIAWDPKSNEFIVQNDEIGRIFYLDKETKLIKSQFDFAGKGDYEDIAIANGTPYILRSDGMLTRVVKDDNGKAIGLDMGKVPLSGTNDFESLYYDPARRALVMLCKNCTMDDKKSVSAFAYYPDSIGFAPKPIFSIDVSDVEKISPQQRDRIQPSAAAIHPILKKLFIVSAASNQLVVTDLDGKVENVYMLSKKLFPQPEGITFKQNGDMYISNEGVGVKATLLKFLYSDSTTDVTGGKLNYDFAVPSEKLELPGKLHEISGMAYIKSEEKILAENDEKGDIYTVDLKNDGSVDGKIKFGGKGDYEDIVHTDTSEYLLVSSGTVVQVKMLKDSSADTKEYTLNLDGNNEFETMYLDSTGRGLILLCKQCAHEKDKSRSAYRYDLKTHTFSNEPVYEIDIATIRQMLNDDKAEFKPSAACINPVTGKLFIVASVGKLLVIADKMGKVEQVFRLDPTLYNQPEGMTFAPNGDLYISNEGGEGVATILKFTYKK